MFLGEVERIVLEPWPEQGEDMKFRLVLRGALPPDKRGVADHKHRIRRELHPQLRTLWQQHGLLVNAWKPRRTADEYNDVPIEKLANEFNRLGYRFVPLVRKGMACSLDILIMRRDEPHKVFAGMPTGDLDNRVKTLIDGLKMPTQLQDVAGVSPSEDENPFFCLLEDDRHIFDISVTTDRLLVPPELNEPERDIVAIIGVHIRLALGAEFAVMTNVSLW